MATSGRGGLWLLRRGIDCAVCCGGRLGGILPLRVCDDFADSREAGFPGNEPLLEKLPLSALECTGGGTDDVECLCSLGQLAYNQTGTEHYQDTFELTVHKNGMC